MPITLCSTSTPRKNEIDKRMHCMAAELEGIAEPRNSGGEKTKKISKKESENKR